MFMGATASKRRPDTGLIRPYRPKPADFREVYIAIGWDGIEDHYQTNWRVIRRWIDEEGREGLVAARAEYVAQERRECQARRRERARRYVLGRTLTVRP